MQIDQTDFTGWMSFLPLNFIDETSCNPEAPSTNIFDHHEIVEKTIYIALFRYKWYIFYKILKCFIISYEVRQRKRNKNKKKKIK